ncbi:MAG TPA: glycosyltransferase family 4 protein [Gaiellaceae bacterium]|nr:glycosyltransferase family 4 protein [Gaiellaceae bacterium]
MRVAFFVFAAEKNTLGRAYSLWLTAEELGWETRFVAPSIESPWTPLAGERDFIATLTDDADGAAEWADALVALKPWPGSLDVALRVGKRYRKPVAVDVDDPDWEAVYGMSRKRQLLNVAQRTGRRQLPVHDYMLRLQTARSEHVLVSNPALHRWYHGATVVPHVRAPRNDIPAHTRTDGLQVTFVGTVTPHKGIDVLRAAVARVGGARLTVTGEAPADAMPHERWLGETSLAEGLALIDEADVVALPSRPWVYSIGQLPAKLIDAMMAGRAVAASDVAPINWALGGTGLLVPPASVEDLVAALERLRSPELRTELGTRAHERALAFFTPAAVAPALAIGLGLLS